MYFCRSWFSNMVSSRYVLVVLNFLHDNFSIKFYTISFLWDLFAISFTIFLLMNAGYWSKSISWKYFIFHEITLKLHFMKCPERKISHCILPLRTPFLQNISGRLPLYSTANLKQVIALRMKYYHWSFL